MQLHCRGVRRCFVVGGLIMANGTVKLLSSLYMCLAAVSQRLAQYMLTVSDASCDESWSVLYNKKW